MNKFLFAALTGSMLLALPVLARADFKFIGDSPLLKITTKSFTPDADAARAGYQPRAETANTSATAAAGDGNAILVLPTDESNNPIGAIILAVYEEGKKKTYLSVGVDGPGGFAFMDRAAKGKSVVRIYVFSDTDKADMDAVTFIPTNKNATAQAYDYYEGVADVKLATDYKKGAASVSLALPSNGLIHKVIKIKAGAGATEVAGVEYRLENVSAKISFTKLAFLGE